MAAKPVPVPDQIAALGERVAPHLIDPAQVQVVTPRRGPLPGQAILNSPHRNAINELIWAQRLSMPKVVAILAERYGITMSTKALGRYIKRHEQMGLGDIITVSRSVGVGKVEQSVEADWKLLDAIVARGHLMIQEGRVSMGEVLKAIALRGKMLGENNAMHLITSEQVYRAALEAIFEVITARCEPETLRLIQGDLLADERFTRAMDQASDPAAKDDDDAE